MKHYKEPDQVTMVGGRAVLNDNECNISLGFLEGILNTRDGKALGEIYENHVRLVGSINVEQAVIEMRGGLV
jgi:hypothetical protein